MAKARKDERGRALKKGEVQRASDKRYMYTYTDPNGQRKFIYAVDLTTLREKEKQLIRDQLDGLDLYVAGKASINDTFDRYISMKHDLRMSTRSNYLYIYDRFVGNTFNIKSYSFVSIQIPLFAHHSVIHVSSYNFMTNAKLLSNCCHCILFVVKNDIENLS